MAHTSEEQWHKKRETLRKDVAQYYKARKIARMIQCELGIGNLPSVDPWSFKNGAMREMAQLLRRSMYAIEGDKKTLGLTPDATKGNTYSWEDKVITHNRFYKRDVPGLRREIMPVEELAQRMDKMMCREYNQGFVFPKYYQELVNLKGISLVWGSARFKYSPSMDNRSHYTGCMFVCHAREIKADWLAEDNIRAFKVVVLPEGNKTVYGAAIGYAARSTITNDINPAFGEDIAKAVSLCKRRVKAEVMKQMGV